VYKAYLLLFLMLFCACDRPDPPDVTSDYGDVYFHIGCYWPDPVQVLEPAVWRCFENVETELLSGFLYLELESSTSLYFCGENLTLRSGISLYDNLIRILTNNKYDCLHITEDKQKGNEFDWVWEENINTLQIIWRPEDSPHKMITLVIKEEEYNQVVRSVVYYRILGEE
jgi:hypothetical protein